MANRQSAARAPGRTAGIIGRTLRLMVGLLLLWMTYAVMSRRQAADNLDVLWVGLGMIFCYLVLHLMARRYRLHPWYGALLALAPLALMFFVGGWVPRVAAVAYLGSSLVLQALRGDGGCAALAIQGLATRSRTHLGCILFLPVDWVESHLSGPGGLPE